MKTRLLIFLLILVASIATAESIYPPFDPDTKTASLRIRTTPTTSGKSVALFYVEGDQIACYQMSPGETQDVQFQVAESTLETRIIGLAYTNSDCTGEVSDTSINTATYPPSTEPIPVKPEPPIIEVPPTEPPPSTSRTYSPEAQWALDYFTSIYQGGKVIAAQNRRDPEHSPDPYQQTAMRGAIQAYDLYWWIGTHNYASQAKVDLRINDALDQRYLLYVHWHWPFGLNFQYATGSIDPPIDMTAVVTPGTEEYTKMIGDLDEAGAIFQQFRDAHVPILWRPLHETGGGWFWWTDTEHPENTVALYRIMWDRFMNHWELNNLIWVFNLAGVNDDPAETLKWYPGDEYVDLVSLDSYIYDQDTPNEVNWWRMWNNMVAQFPNKMVTLGESGKLLNADLMATGLLPKWLWVMAWYGAPHFGGQFGGRPDANRAREQMRSNTYITLDELPAFGPIGVNIQPVTGILSPVNNGTAIFPDGTVNVEAYAVDRDGSIASVDLYLDDAMLLQKTSPPYNFTFSPPVGSHQIKVVATDNQGATMASNEMFVLAGVRDAALNQPVVASGRQFEDKMPPEQVVDGDYYSFWVSENADDQWIYVDLGESMTVDAVNMKFGFKVHPQNFSIDVATENPELPESWTTVYSEEHETAWCWNSGYYVRYGKTYLLNFPPVQARYVRFHPTLRVVGQTWKGYEMTLLQVPVPISQ